MTRAIATCTKRQIRNFRAPNAVSATVFAKPLISMAKNWVLGQIFELTACNIIVTGAPKLV